MQAENYIAESNEFVTNRNQRHRVVCLYVTKNNRLTNNTAQYSTKTINDTLAQFIYK